MTTRTFIPKPWQIVGLRDKKITLLVVPVATQPPELVGGGHYYDQYDGRWRLCWRIFTHGGPDDRHQFVRCPFGSPGTILNCKEGYRPTVLPTGAIYRADHNPMDYATGWRSPVTMPSSFVRIKPTVASVECKRVREITEAQAKAYGMLDKPDMCGFPMSATRRFQDQLGAIDHPGAWESNAWCWFCILTWKF